MIRVHSYAKINLFLDVVEKRSDGYHNLEMIMQSIDLCDYITVEKSPHGIDIQTQNYYLPTDEKNIAYKAAKLLMERKKRCEGVKINIEKHIPVAAGLGGGSSNAAAVLNSIVKLFDLEIKQSELSEIALQLGADVPFFLKGGTSQAKGIGEQLTALSYFDHTMILLVKPNFDISTADIFKNYRMQEKNKKASLEDMICALENRDVSKISKNLYNSLEDVVCSRYPEVADLKIQMINNGAIGSLMSGSGPSVFGVFNEAAAIDSAFSFFKKNFINTFIVKTVDKSMNFV